MLPVHIAVVTAANIAATTAVASASDVACSCFQFGFNVVACATLLSLGRSVRLLPLPFSSPSQYMPFCNFMSLPLSLLALTN